MRFWFVFTVAYSVATLITAWQKSPALAVFVFIAFLLIERQSKNDV